MSNVKYKHFENVELVGVLWGQPLPSFAYHLNSSLHLPVFQYSPVNLCTSPFALHLKQSVVLHYIAFVDLYHIFVVELKRLFHTSVINSRVPCLSYR